MTLRPAGFLRAIRCWLIVLLALALLSIAEIVVAPVVGGMILNRPIGDRWTDRDGGCALGSAAAIELVIAIEVGMQNSALAVALAQQ